MIKREDLDEETIKLMFRYCGGDPWARRNVSTSVFYEYGEETWSVPEFQDAITTALASVPLEYQESAIVTFQGGDYDSRGELDISYKRPETDDEIAIRVQRAYDHVQEGKEEERRNYERLKLKFEG